MTTTCSTCTNWTRVHTATPWFPPSVGHCMLTLPPWITNYVEQLAPPYMTNETQQDDTCSFHAPGRVEPEPVAAPSPVEDATE